MRAVRLFPVSAIIALGLVTGFWNAGLSAKDNEKENDQKTEQASSDEKESKKEDKEIKTSANPEEQAIRKEAEEYCRAFCEHDARSAAKHFTENAEFVLTSGQTLSGREEIEGSLKTCFEEGGDCRLELSVDSIRFPSASVAIEDGTSWTIHDGEEKPVNYTAVHVKEGDTWRIASVREREVTSARPHHDKLRQLDWLLGDWMDDSSEALVLFSCRPVDNGNFLIRDFTVQIGDQPAMTGTQRIGWDPITRGFRVWYFDSEGGFGDGTWSKRGDDWVMKLNGVTADGELASGTYLYTIASSHRVTWRAIDQVVGSDHLEDATEVTLVRQSPAPRSATEKSNTKTSVEEKTSDK